VDWLVHEVEARNPSLQALIFAWQSAAQKYPQAVSLDDPMFMSMIAPGSVNSATTETGYVLEAAQKFPWFGKRDARGQRALADADMAGAQVEEIRLQQRLPFALLAVRVQEPVGSPVHAKDPPDGFVEELRDTHKVFLER
jgi:hypothetical protein